MNFFIIDLTKEDKRACEYVLSTWTPVCKHVCNDAKAYPEKSVLKLLKYEMDTRRRPQVLDRLAGRFSKLRRKREWLQIVNYVKTINRKPTAELYERPKL